MRFFERLGISLMFTALLIAELQDSKTPANSLDVLAMFAVFAVGAVSFMLGGLYNDSDME